MELFMFLPLALLVFAMVLLGPLGTVATLLFLAATFDRGPTHAVKINLPVN